MKRYLPIVALVAAGLLLFTGLKAEPGPPEHPDNCFGGYVYNTGGQPVEGMTVKLVPPVGFTELFLTTEQGEYWFCRPYGGWDSGWYTIIVGCCQKQKYREGDGNIFQDFTIPCDCQ
jgi:hypothetical protein